MPAGAIDGQRLPPPHGLSYTIERAYPKLLAPLGEQPTVWCECLFVDPIADIAVLGSPDYETLSEEAEAYVALVEAATSLTVAEPPSQPIPEEVAQLAELAKTIWGNWISSRGKTQMPRLLAVADQSVVSVHSRAFIPTACSLLILDAARGIAGGMSGSPIIAEDGTAIGIVCLGSGSKTAFEGGPNPRLMGNLPGWLLQSLADAAKVAAAEDDADFEANIPPLVELLAENLAIYDGSVNDDEAYLAQAREILRQYRAAHGRDPAEYMEVEEFFLSRQQGRHLRDVKSAANGDKPPDQSA